MIICIYILVYFYYFHNFIIKVREKNKINRAKFTIVRIVRTKTFVEILLNQLHSVLMVLFVLH